MFKLAVVSYRVFIFPTLNFSAANQQLDIVQPITALKKDFIEGKHILQLQQTFVWKYNSNIFVQKHYWKSELDEWSFVSISGDSSIATGSCLVKSIGSSIFLLFETARIPGPIGLSLTQLKTRLRWLLRPLALLNPLPQSSHLNGRSPVWSIRWSWRPVSVENPFPHSLHLNGLL